MASSSTLAAPQSNAEALEVMIENNIPKHINSFIDIRIGSYRELLDELFRESPFYSYLAVPPIHKDFVVVNEFSRFP